MREFIKTKATKLAIYQRTSVVGCGVNDAWYVTNPTIGGNKVMCPTYCKWMNMLKRACGKKYKKRNPSYEGVTVCDEWLSFSNFARWLERNSVKGFDLDKDIKIKGNKIYSPDTCLFVHNSVNKLLISRSTLKGPYPTGVSIDKRTGKFRARVTIDGFRVCLGWFVDMTDAGNAYINAKNKEIHRKANQYPAIKQYLLGHLL